MSLKQNIEDDLIQALKARNQNLVCVLKLLKNSIKNKEIEFKKELDDNVVIEILFSELKKRKDSVEHFKKGKRDDLVQKEESEIKVIKKYLPEMKSKDEIKNIVCDIIKREGIEKSMSNFGTIMKIVMQELAGQAEGNLVSKIVKEELS